MSALSNHQKSFVRFCAVGVVNTAIDFGVFLALFYGLSWGLVASHAAAFLIATINSFALNKVWTFGDKTPVSARQFTQFLLVTGGGLALSSAVVWVAGHMLHPIVAKGCAIIVTLIWDYAGSRFWVFRQGETRR